MSIVLAGGAGFIGSKLAKRFLDQGEEVLILDNLCRGRREYVANLQPQEHMHFVQLDIAEELHTLEIMRAFHERSPISAVWHMAANSDIPAGIADASVDLRDTFMTTFSLLQAMKELKIPALAFASSSAIYGDFGPGIPLHENIGPLLPISNYGAMKLASEGLISAAVESWLSTAWVFRFPNVVGIPATHGVILDFVRKLQATPDTLQVLGNGTQQKAYLHVDDLVEAMLFITKHAHEKNNIFNVGPEDSGCSVRDIAEAVVARVSPKAVIAYGREGRGWVGDVPQFSYSVEKLATFGWKTRHTSLEAVQKAVREIASQEGA